MGEMVPYLIHINLSRNAFGGSIPSSIGKMRILEVLDLSSNNLSGEVPKQLVRNCRSLRSLALSNNKFHGQMFSDDFKLTQIEYLRLNDNQFTGPLTNVVFNLSKLSILDISNNNMSGKILDSMNNMIRLRTLIMRNNAFNGQFPCALIPNVFMDISHNSFLGTLTSCSNPNLGVVVHVHLQGNHFTKFIPEALINLSKLVTLDASDNNLSGSIPLSIRLLANLSILILRGNQLGGSIPTQLCQLNKISLMDLSNNSFTGSIPSCLSNITFGATGATDLPFAQTPLEFYSTRRIFYVYENVLLPHLDMVFEIGGPDGTYDKVDEVEFITKSRTNSYRAGSILNFMSGLDLSCNKLTGEIPFELGKLSSVRALNLSHNLLIGPIPKTFSNLTQIESLDLSYNNLSGNIPTDLINLNFLAVFIVAHNNLSGSRQRSKTYNHMANTTEGTSSRQEDMLKDGYEMHSQNKLYMNAMIPAFFKTKSNHTTTVSHHEKTCWAPTRLNPLPGHVALADWFLTKSYLLEEFILHLSCLYFLNNSQLHLNRGSTEIPSSSITWPKNEIVESQNSHLLNLAYNFRSLKVRKFPVINTKTKCTVLLLTKQYRPSSYQTIRVLPKFQFLKLGGGHCIGCFRDRLGSRHNVNSSRQRSKTYNHMANTTEGTSSRQEEMLKDGYEMHSQNKLYMNAMIPAFFKTKSNHTTTVSQHGKTCWAPTRLDPLPGHVALADWFLTKRLERLVEGLTRELRQMSQQNASATSTQAEQTNGRHAVPPPPPPVPQVPPQPALYGDGTIALIREFKKMKPPRFSGGIEPMKADAWVLEMEKLFEIFPSTDTQKVTLAAFTFDDDARRWWMMIREANPDRKTTEFQALTQGNKTVADYDRAFTELARYTPYMVSDEYRKARKFESGLHGPIQDRVNMLNMPTYAEVLDKAILAEANLNRYQNSGESQRKRQNYEGRRMPLNAKKKANMGSSSNSNRDGNAKPTCASCRKPHLGVCRWATGACFECGETGHRVKDCPTARVDDGKKNGSTSGSAH
ncbi:hypothetical protein HYC85_027713 [Camellia sinensis]|uniref:CCHC-type domain-containing protein n=1 Tax=Camellia sinensis TaxID=4442 RepID=A0A7J7FT93_CAMSI|nr:hypothetical protein HYC85_027713 [Camellia sinensis]